MNNSLMHIHPSAEIADTVIIEPFVTIQKNVEIAAGTWIGPNVTIMEGARIGKYCKIYPGAVISAIPQDLKYKGEDTLTYIGDNVVVRECVTVSKGTADRHKTVVHENCLLMAYAHIAHDCNIGKHCIIANNVQIGGHVHIDEYAVLGGSSAVHQFVKIGTHAIISGGSMVKKDVPPFTKAARDPLRYCGINTIGLKRKGFSQEILTEIQEIYRKFFLQGYNYTKAIKLIEREVPASIYRDEILSFIKRSSRGVMKGY